MRNGHQKQRLRDENEVVDDGQYQDLEEEFNDQDQDQEQEQVFNEE